MAKEAAAHDEWQLAEIAAGLAEANRGEFASDAEVERVFAKYRIARPQRHQEQTPTGGTP